MLFTFSAANPWAASAWDFLKLISKKWLKRVVFVIQQADLRDAGGDRRHRQAPGADDDGADRPFLPDLSRLGEARLPGENQRRRATKSAGARSPRPASTSSRRYINDEVAHGEARMTKLRSVCQTAQVILRDLGGKVREAMAMVERDTARLAELDHSIVARKEQSVRQLSGVIWTLSQSYDRAQRRGEELLLEKLTLGNTFKLILGKGDWRYDFQKRMEDQLRDTLQRQIGNSLELLEADLRTVWQQLHDTLRRNFSDSQPRARHAAGFRGEARRTAAQDRAHAAGARHFAAGGAAARQALRGDGQLAPRAGRRRGGGRRRHGHRDPRRTPRSLMSPARVAGVAAVTGTAIALVKRRKILAEFARQMTEKRDATLAGIEDHLRHSIDRFYLDLAGMFQPLQNFCSTQRKLYEPMLQRLRELEESLGRQVATLSASARN